MLRVGNLQRSIDFYTQQLGFKLDMKNLPAFGQVSVEGLKLILSGPGASGSGAGMETTCPSAPNTVVK